MFRKNYHNLRPELAAYHVAADELEQEARRLRDQAARAQRREEIEQRLADLKTLQPDALDQAHPLSVDHHRRQADKRAKAAEKHKRNIDIVRMAARGMMDAEIAKRTGLHRVTVNRIIRKAIRENQPS